MNDKEKLLELLREQKEANRTNQLKFYSPYPFQEEFHNDLEQFVGLIAGNRPGKCGTIASKVETPNGSKSFGEIFGTECEVLTWPNKEPRKVVNWIRKPAEECFRFTMSDGQWFECPRGHLILTEHGYVPVSQLLDAFPSLIEKARHSPSVERTWLHSPLATKLGISQLIRVLSDRHCIRKLRDYLGGYLVDRRLCDEQLLSEEDSVQVFAPSQGDVQLRISFLYNLDGLANKYIGSPLNRLYRLSTQCVDRLILGLCGPFLSQGILDDALYRTQSSQSGWQLNDFAYHQQLTDATSTHQYQSSSSLSPVTIEGNHIVSIRSVGVNVLYDMEVEERHNYIAAGMVHHNSFSGGAHTAFHLTGRYPDWWEGRRYTHPVKWVCGGKNNEKTRDLLQGALFGEPSREDAWGTGFVPKKDIGKYTRKPGVPDAKYHVFVRHHTDGVFDGWSKITFLAYDMGKDGWMGFPSDGVWLDEEPPEDIMGQANRCIVDLGGIVYMTFTPENGKTSVLNAIMANWSMHYGSWMDASGSDFELDLAGDTLQFKTIYSKNGTPGHLTEEKVRGALKGMLPHEARMRVLGEPMMGSGLIFSYPQEQLMCEPIELPDHWPRIAAIDFGGISKKSHPTAVAWLAIDEQNDTAYVYDCLKMFSNEPADVAARIIGRPQWMPMIYPHDGEKTVGSGGTVADLYRRYGVNMFHTHATNFDEEKDEGKGGIKIEPGIIDMNARFADRRLRIFSTLPEVWEELRNYHTAKTQTGTVKIVDRDDDLIAAIRYALMMKRHAVKESEVMEWEEEEFEESYSGRCSNTGY